ncbi:MAG: F0F1 ATP synthase subunit delta [Candidatus Omnitrophica bacterium]|nr:F0F1 ATP synthase subunit delta [Candidatus Omnitrophota bacterium]MBU1923874.1 F0F1 ATP synthase subunit delta [Candidatus Omnitrophota bacterium]
MLVWQIILIQIATFTLIVLFLRWLLYNHISRALERLQKLNQQNLEKEKVLKEELDRARKQAEIEIKQGKVEAESIKEQAKEDGENTRRNLLEASKEEAKRIVNEGVRDSQRKYNDLLLEMQDKAVYLAVDIVRYIFTERIHQVLHAQVIDELIEDVSRLDKEKIRAQGDKAEIVCAYPLEAGQKQKLQQALSSKLERNIVLEETIEQEIVGGLIIRLSGFVVIDGSIKNKFKRILPIMRDKARAGIGQVEKS